MWQHGAIICYFFMKFFYRYEIGPLMQIDE
jgi:hypothetical protein